MGEVKHRLAEIELEEVKRRLAEIEAKLEVGGA